MHGKKFMYVCMYACMHDHIQVRRKHGGLRFKVKESRVDTVSGESRALGNSNRVLKRVPKSQPLRCISWCHETNTRSMIIRKKV
jgi:hypothetical protein